MMRSHLLVAGSVLVLLAVGTCAKRMPPPSPDRFAPRLVLVRTRGLTGVEMEFDEPVDLSRVPAESLAIVGPDGVLEVRGLTSPRGGDRLLAWTERQDEVVYHLSAWVPDLAGNFARVRARFRGGSRPDTVRPRVRSVRPRLGQSGYFSDEITYEFSKPMDTLVIPELVAIPASLDTALMSHWDAGWQRLTLKRPGKVTVDLSVADERDERARGTESEPDSGGVRTTDADAPSTREDSAAAPPVYVALLPGMTDLEGNRTREIVATSFTRDTLFPGMGVAGRVSGPVPALVFLLADTAVALAVTDERGVFFLRIPGGTYEVVAVSDTSHDGLVDLVARRSSFVPGPDSLFLDLQPEFEPRAVGEYRR
ncbi:MAG TPA: hypothetical protein ENN51_09240 [candidate division WOR-3 bacterium]|mgnify:CR=1 FL=1|uniref:Uncharacterized protein n=1 Tax=candidate division WOR-3 bacterium TaxID=2052148 RepID=A0A7V0T779_UNCW3|nr:hypothetical protein [candidate division WOR-3 bacterium]